jgi:hypothetical protein
VRGGTDPTLVVESVYYPVHELVLSYTRVRSGDIPVGVRGKTKKRERKAIINSIVKPLFGI